MMTAENFIEYLKSLGVNPNKTYGQNFLKNDLVMEDIIDSANIKSTDLVVEIGSGIGNLTERIADKAKQVIAIEKDTQFENILRKLIKKKKNIKVHYGDILSTNFWPDVEQEYKVVANIPYYITGKILQLFLRAKHKPLSLTLLTQKEVAQNITAKPGKLNLLGLSVQLVGDARLVRIVEAKDFFPAPKVTSAVIQINLRKESLVSEEDEKLLFKILHSAFLGKRKQLHNSLVSNLKIEKELVEKILRLSDINTESRPQELSLGDWLRLLENYKKNV